MSEAELIRASRSPAHRALARTKPAALRDALAAFDSVAVDFRLAPQEAAKLERVFIHQLAKALGVKA